MSSGEKRTIISVLVLYLFSTFLVVGLVSFSYYNYVKKEQIEKEKTLLKEDAKSLFSKLQMLHNNQKEKIKYPRFDSFNSAIYDIDKNMIFSTCIDKNIVFESDFYKRNNMNYFIYDITPYYLGAAFIVIEKKELDAIKDIKIQVISLTLFILLIIVLTSYFLVKIILKPIRENLKLLDRFIKDTTHELNTPVSTILTNIELLENELVSPKISKKINRIKTAGLTISNIYEDLVFLILNHKISINNENIKINSLIKDRIEYFDILFKSKKLKVIISENDEAELFIDRKQISRLIDNLLSNAIKYTKKETTIKIDINKSSFFICDEGIGMSEEEVSKIFDRYTRFDKTQGGFGIGYNIIDTIVKEYNLDIKIDSKIGVGTCVRLSW